MELPLHNILMFKSWPKVKVNRNDSEIIMFSKYFNVIDKNNIVYHMTNNFEEDEPKSKDVANTFRIEGNKCYNILNYDLALEKYNISISRAPRDSNEFSLAIANRSAVLFDMKKYKECLEDIDLVLRSEFPKNLLYKVLLRQSKCYLECCSFSKAEESLQKAKDYFNKENMSRSLIAMVEDNIKTLTTQINERKGDLLCIEADNNSLPPAILRDGENPKFLNASKAIYFKHRSQVERCVIATSDIKKGDFLFIEEPYAMMALDRQPKCFTTCSLCLQTSLNCIPCTSCSKRFYCSSKCQRTAWNSVHKWECFSDSHQIIMDVRLKLGLAILLKASHEGFKTAVEDVSIYGNKDNNYPFMNKLLTHKNKIPEFVLDYNVQAAVWIVMYLKSCTDYFDWLYVQPNRPEGTRDDLYNFVGGYLVKYLLQIGCNLDVIQEGEVCVLDKNVSVNYVGVGIGIYLSSALLNHSCVPNAAVSFQDNVKVVRALKDIPPETEITINYLGGTDDMETEDRQSELEKYIFKCSCVACINPNYEEIFDPLLCHRCHGKAYPLQRKKFAKCVECKWVFNRREYNRNENKIAQLFLMFQLTEQLCDKGTLHNLIKRTYHKDNFIYIAFYNACAQHHHSLGEYKKAIDSCKSSTKAAENIYGDASKQYLITVLKLTYLLVEYSNILKKQNSPLYQNFVGETKEYLQKSVTCLQYYIGPKNIKVFVENITEYLNSGKISNQHAEEEEHILSNLLREFSAYLG